MVEYGNDADDEEMEDVEQEGTSNDETTTSGVGDTTGGTDGSQAKRRRKERRQNTVGTLREEFTEVDLSGLPTLPLELAKGYSNTTAAILLETVPITTGDIRDKENVALAALLI